MRRVLALDLGTNTGWATNVPQAPGYGSGVRIFDGEVSGWRYLAFKQWLDVELERLRIDHIIYEETFSKGAYAARVLHGFLAILQFTHAQRYPNEDTRITISKVYASSLKKFATGNGRATKDDMVAAAKARGWELQDDNEADALFLLHFAEEKLK